MLAALVNVPPRPGARPARADPPEHGLTRQASARPGHPPPLRTPRIFRHGASRRGRSGSPVKRPAESSREEAGQPLHQETRTIF